MFRLLGVLILFTVFYHVVGEFIFPEVKFEAFVPKGFRVSIPDVEGTTEFTFRGKFVSYPKYVEQDEIAGTVYVAIGKRWTFFAPNMTARVGDILYCWLEIYNGGQFYFRDDLRWKVKELKTLESSCTPSKTDWQGKKNLCAGQEIFFARFDSDSLDTTLWKQAHFIPSEPDFEFCSYRINENTLYIWENKLTFQPEAALLEKDLRGSLDLRDRCTSNLESECIVRQDGGFFLPPVNSSRVTLRSTIKYGVVEIKAKIPCGDWLYPEIYLQSAYTPRKKIRIAYARGNEVYTCNGVDESGSKLYGGPMLRPDEPERSKFLSSTKSRKSFCGKFHVYSLVWEADKITVSVDDVLYGEYTSNITSEFNEPMYLILGVGVGGINDFPDYCVGPKGNKKPWENSERLMFKKFFLATHTWRPSWFADSQMQIDYVKFSAV